MRTRTALLARNLASALGSVRVQQWLLVVLRLHGPLTRQELLAIAGARTTLTENSLLKLLAKLKRVQAVKHWRIGPTFALWTVAHAEKPDRRQAAHPVPIERRAEPVAHGSWWIQPTRDAFVGAAQRRWTA